MVALPVEEAFEVMYVMSDTPLMLSSSGLMTDSMMVLTSAPV